MSHKFRNPFIVMFLFVLMVSLSPQVLANTTDLFISEYIEGSSNNKVIEIYNGTGSSVDLSAGVYSLELYSNGSATPSQTLNLSGTIADGDVFVLAHPSADPAILAVADVTNGSVINFNGDDAVVLRKNGAVVDAFGQVGFDPGSEWGSSPTDTQDNTLRRKADVCGGDTDETNAFDPSVEWDGFGNNSFDGLDSHTANCDGGPSDTAPQVVSSTPTDGAVNVAVDAAVSITFNEAVSLSGTFDLICTPSGNDQTGISPTTGDDLTFNFAHSDFTQGDTCSLTIPANSVTDNDGDDPPDNMAGIFDLSFTIVTPAPASDVIITEIMYDPNSAEDNWEWVEIYNAGGSSVDLSGYVIDDNNSTAHGAANIASGSLDPGQSAVLYNVDDVSAADFQAAWGTVNLIAVTNWTAMGLNNGGDKVSLWSSFASYSGHNVDHLNAIDTVDYTQGGFPDPVGASIYLTDLNADNNVGSNWETSTDGGATPLFTAYTSLAAGGNSGADVGSPGTPPVTSNIQQLLLSEIVVTPTSGEFVEIYNPNGTAVDLSDVYLTDATFAGGDTYYYNIVTDSNAGGGGFSDFHARFPDGASIAPGEYQTIALNGATNFTSAYGSSPTYELFDVDGAVPDMREALPGSINGQGGLTNDGEVVILYTWDGSSDLVTDLDYMLWGDKAEAVDKTGVAIDGPDADSDTDTYLNDTAITSQDVIDLGEHAVNKSWQREDLTEGAEIKTGGNGADGHDETSEDSSNTVCSGNPTPNAAASCDADTPVTEAKIHEVQGSGGSVAISGSVMVEAIVIADYQGNDQLSGFFIQEEDADADSHPNTSEGIFVFCGNGCGTSDVAVGDLVEVTGQAEEFFGMSQIDVTGGGSVSITSSGNALPTPTSIGLPAGGSTEAEATFENVEGMLVTFSNSLFVSEYFELARYAHLVLTADARPRQFTDANEPSVPGFAAFLDDLSTRRIFLDDDNNFQNEALGGNNGDNPALDEPFYWPRPGLSNTNLLRGGDSISGLTGVLHWSFAGQSGTDAWRIRPVEEAFSYNFTSNNPRTAAPNAVGGTFKVASLNVLNYFTTINSRGADSTAELDRQRVKTAAAICAMDADIVGLIEIENNAGVALDDLLNGTDGINANCGPYNGINTGVIGTDEIVVAFIYKPATVSPVGSHAILDSSVDLRFDDTKNRPALAHSFDEIATGGRLTIVVNHLKSKGSACDDVGDPDINDGQGNCSGTRTSAAEAMVDWLANDPTGSGDPDVLIIGDLNSYRNEDPIDAIEAGSDDTASTSDDFTDLIDSFGGANAYSYVFDGQLGYLDYALANQDLLSQVTGVTEWSINADEIPVFDYNDDIEDVGNESFFERESTSLPIYEPNAYRASDHDPVIVGLSLTGPVAQVPQCNGVDATVYVSKSGMIVGGLNDGNTYHQILRGTLGNDVIVGTEDDEIIIGLAGDDLICGLGGKDLLDGRFGQDTLFGGDNNDLLTGGPGNDTLNGEGGRDLLSGGLGSDTCDGGDDNDIALGCENQINIP